MDTKDNKPSKDQAPWRPEKPGIFPPATLPAAALPVNGEAVIFPATNSPAALPVADMNIAEYKKHSNEELQKLFESMISQFTSLTGTDFTSSDTLLVNMQKDILYKCCSGIIEHLDIEHCVLENMRTQVYNTPDSLPLQEDCFEH